MFAKKLRTEYLCNPLGIDVVKPRFSWVLEEKTKQSEKNRGKMQSAFRILVATNEEDIKKNIGNAWDSQKISNNKSNQIEYEGETLQSGCMYYWKIQIWDENDAEGEWSEMAYFSTGLFSNKEWSAKWIGTPEETRKKIHVKDESKKNPQEVLQSPPSPLLRKTIQITKEIKQATLFVSALGEYEFYINGKRVGDHILAPEWTDYSKRVQYQTFDVKELLYSKTNALGAMLGDGWYLGLLGPGDQIRQLYYGKNRLLIAQLDILFNDGTKQRIVTDETWKICKEGPIQSADHFLGEVYDATKDSPGWNTPEFIETDSNVEWTTAFVDDKVKVNLISQRNEPIRIFERIKPISLTEPQPGLYIFDMGQNMAGWCEFKFQGKKGQEIVLRHGEMLELNGTLYTENLRLASQTDKFTLDGTDRLYHPHFTFHGFRYVEVTGLEEKPTRDFLTGCAFTSNAPLVGDFECSNKDLNQLWKNILWTQRDNMHSIPTDCPQRNERMGWTGDAQVFAQTAIFNLDMATFFGKYIQDLRDAQSLKGAYPDFAPLPYPKDDRWNNGPGWADAGIEIPWKYYLSYGDTRILAEHFESAKKYIDNIHNLNPKLIWEHWGSNYGDWLNGDKLIAKDYPKKGAGLNKKVYATAFFAYSTKLVAKFAQILGKTEEAAHYNQLATQIRAAFVKKFVKRNGKIKGNTQSGYAIALAFDLLPAELRTKAVKLMIEAIHKYDDRISTGFVSTIRMMMMLSEGGENEMAYKLAESHRFPSWIYSIDQGATTIWERWDGYVEGRGFQSKGMNSFNHYSIGAIGEWMYRVMLGINFDESNPAMKHCIIKPQPGGSITYAKGSYESLNGKISVDWQLNSGKLSLKTSIPPNTTATITIPSKNPKNTKEADNILSSIDCSDDSEYLEIKFAQDHVELKVKSGNYHFTTNY